MNYINLNNQDFLNFQGNNMFATTENDYNFLGICFGGKNCIEKRESKQEYRQEKRDAKIDSKNADSLLTKSVAELAASPSNSGSGDNTLLYVGLGIGVVILGGVILMISRKSKVA